MVKFFASYAAIFGGVSTALIVAQIVFVANSAYLKWSNAFPSHIVLLLLELVGVLGLPVAVGLWTRKPWARLFAIGVFVMLAVLRVTFRLTRPGDFVLEWWAFQYCLVALAAIRYFLSQGARKYFA